MTELAMNIQKLKATKAECKSDIKRLNILARNSIQLIRTKLDLLQLDNDEDILELDIASAYEEMNQLRSLRDEMKQKKDRMEVVDKELKSIQKELSY